MTQPLLWQGYRALAGLFPLVFLLSVACSRSNEPPRVQSHPLDPYALQIDVPVGWTGGGAGGTYEFHGPDGQGRLRVGPLEGVNAVAGLKDAQLLAGTGATPASRLVTASPTKVGALAAVRARLAGSDGRVYEVLAVQLPAGAGVVLVQASVTSGYAAESSAASDELFAVFRQSLKYNGQVPAGPSSAHAP